MSTTTSAKLVSPSESTKARDISGSCTPSAGLAEKPPGMLTGNSVGDTSHAAAPALRGRGSAAIASAKMNWNDIDDVPSDVLNRILWGDAKGWNVPYPGGKR